MPGTSFRPGAYVWRPGVILVPQEQLERYLDTQPQVATETSQKQRCQVCSSNEDAHKMRYRLLDCRSQVCAEAAANGEQSNNVCDAWMKTLTCLATGISSAFHHRTHAVGGHLEAKTRMPLVLRRFTREKAAQGARPMWIYSDMIDKFPLDETTAPKLRSVQSTAGYHKKKTLKKNSYTADMSEILHTARFHDALDEITPFAFGFQTDAFGSPVVGNGTDARPFFVGVSTKRLIRGLAHAATFPFHVDGTCKVNQESYPVVICGVSDASRSFKFAAACISSHLRQGEYGAIFEAVFEIYYRVTGFQLVVRNVCGDADDAQFNGFQSVVQRRCPDATYIMCFFHVMMNVKKRALRVAEEDRQLIYKYIYRMHHARDQAGFDQELATAIRVWSGRQTLQDFVRYFTAECLGSRFARWQCFQTPAGHATTNNPVEQCNREIKRDVTNKLKLTVNGLMKQLMLMCKTRSVKPNVFAQVSSVTPDLSRRVKYLTKGGLMSHTRVQLASLDFMMDEQAVETHVLIRQHGVQREGHPLSTTDEDRLHSLFVETYRQPASRATDGPSRVLG